jgi:hypothetical protein
MIVYQPIYDGIGRQENHRWGNEKEEGREGRTGNTKDRTVMELGCDSILDLPICLVVNRSSSLV